MNRFSNVLFAVEDPTESAQALERAIALAEHNQGSLTVVSVVEPLTYRKRLLRKAPSSADLQARLVRERGRELDELAGPYRNRLEVQCKVLTGSFFLEVVREVLRSGRDLVIKASGSGDSGAEDRGYSSSDMHLLRKCPCPVWLVRSKETKPYRRIVAAVDLDDDYPSKELTTRQALNRQILQMAIALALSESAELHVVHVWQAVVEGPMRSVFADIPEAEITAYLEDLQQRYGKALDTLLCEVSSADEAFASLKPKTHLFKGSARRQIPVLVQGIDADLVVMGTVGRVGVPGFLIGNTAEAILNQIDCSVLAIKPAGFTSPVTLED